MGATVAKQIAGLRRKELRVLMVGLDAAGKSTLLWKMKQGDVELTVPTIGFLVETASMSALDELITVTSWDMGGRQPLRPLWRHYYALTSGVIFVVDASEDTARTEQVADELQRMLREDELLGVPILIFANKQDLPGAMSGRELHEKLGLGLAQFRGSRCLVQESTIMKGEGVQEGLGWLCREMRKGRQVPKTMGDAAADMAAKSVPQEYKDMNVEGDSVKNANV